MFISAVNSRWLTDPHDLTYRKNKNLFQDYSKVDGILFRARHIPNGRGSRDAQCSVLGWGDQALAKTPRMIAEPREDGSREQTQEQPGSKERLQPLALVVVRQSVF
jgi:hypothetical protein